MIQSVIESQGVIGFHIDFFVSINNLSAFTLDPKKFETSRPSSLFLSILNTTMIAGTLQTDPRSGGVKKSSGVKVLPIVAETWNKVRDDKDSSTDWLICGYVENSKTDITILSSGSGGPAAAAAALPEGEPVFGGCRMSNGRFMGFYHCPEDVSGMKKGRASMHKNGVLNVLEGRDGEIDMKPGYTE